VVAILTRNVPSGVPFSISFTSSLHYKIILASKLGKELNISEGNGCSWKWDSGIAQWLEVFAQD